MRSASWLDEYNLVANATRAIQPWHWMMALEEYEALFPETAIARGDLGVWVTKLTAAIGATAAQLLVDPARDAALVRLRELSHLVADYNALAHDMGIHIQNVTFAGIAGTSVPHRQPLDPGVPQLLLEAGSLVIRPGLPSPVALASAYPPGENGS